MLYLDKIICLILSDNVKAKNKYVAKKTKPHFTTKQDFVSILLKHRLKHNKTYLKMQFLLNQYVLTFVLVLTF